MADFKCAAISVAHLGAAAEDQLAELVLPPVQHVADAARVDCCEKVQPTVAREPALAEAAATQLCAQRYVRFDRAVGRPALPIVRVTRDGC